MVNRFIVIAANDGGTKAMFAKDMQTAQEIMLKNFLDSIGHLDEYFAHEGPPSERIRQIKKSGILDKDTRLEKCSAYTELYGAHYNWAIFDLAVQGSESGKWKWPYTKT